MVTLYDIDMDGSMVSHPDGDWVRHDDYVALETRVAELEKDVAWYQARVDSL